MGSGGGSFIIREAIAHPERNYLGVEPAGAYFYYMKSRLAKRGLANVRICRTDAADLIASVFPPECVFEYHIYHPDPWPKKRHRKRRLFTPAFCRDLERTLRPDGVLFFQTDHEEYYAELLPLLRALLEVREHPEPWPDAPLGRTNFEIKYLREGRKVYRLVANRRKA